MNIDEKKKRASDRKREREDQNLDKTTERKKKN